MRMILAGAGCLAVLAAFSPGARAQSQSDIVWPTYDEIERGGDTALSCDGLAAEIRHVSADVALLNKAKTRTEDVLHSAFDLERYSGSTMGGHFVRTSEVQGKENYAAAREQIVASLHYASARRDFLGKLVPYCKPASPR